MTAKFWQEAGYSQKVFRKTSLTGARRYGPLRGGGHWEWCQSVGDIVNMIMVKRSVDGLGLWQDVLLWLQLVSLWMQLPLIWLESNMEKPVRIKITG